MNMRFLEYIFHIHIHKKINISSFLLPHDIRKNLSVCMVKIDTYFIYKIIVCE